MEELLNKDRKFARFYLNAKHKWKHQANSESDEEAREQFKTNVLKQYIKALEMRGPRRISWGKVSRCYRISPFIIKKVFQLEKHRMSWELEALKKLAPYPYFPKVLLIEPENKTFYMTDVGPSIKEVRRASLMPRNLNKQVDGLINALQTTGIFHRDLALAHIRMHNGQLALIDFEKCWLTPEQYEEHKAANTGTWQKLRYYDMGHIRKLIEKHCKTLYR